MIAAPRGKHALLNHLRAPDIAQKLPHKVCDVTRGNFVQSIQVNVAPGSSPDLPRYCGHVARRGQWTIALYRAL